MQHIECNRSLLITRANVPSRVQFVSAPAIRYPNPKNKEWDYFKGIPMSSVTSRQGFQGGRALACMYIDHDEPVKIFKGLTCPNYEEHPILTDGSKKNKPKVDLDVLDGNTLLIFFSSLNKCDSHISDMNSVYDEVKKRGDMYKIVWIPVVKQWNEEEEKEFKRLRAQMPWYVAKCRSPILDLKRKWGYKDKPILVVMNRLGHVTKTIDLPLNRKNGMKAFYKMCTDHFRWML